MLSGVAGTSTRGWVEDGCAGVGVSSRYSKSALEWRRTGEENARRGAGPVDPTLCEVRAGEDRSLAAIVSGLR